MTTLCAHVIPKALVDPVDEENEDAEEPLTIPAHICKELADGFWKGTSYCVEHLELVATGKG